MIFHEHRCIYFHIGKAAGTAVEQLLRDEKRDWRVPDHVSMFGWDPDERIFLQHATAATVRRFADAEVFDQYYKFAVVRNPYARMISVYYYLYEAHQKQFGDFEDYVKALASLVVSPEAQSGSHYLPQTTYTHIDGRPVCDHVAHFESLPSSLDPVRQQLGITSELPRANAYRHSAYDGRPTAEHYTEETIQIIQEIYADDFEQFGYPLDPAHA